LPTKINLGGGGKEVRLAIVLLEQGSSGCHVLNGVGCGIANVDVRATSVAAL